MNFRFKTINLVLVLFCFTTCIDPVDEKDITSEKKNTILFEQYYPKSQGEFRFNSSIPAVLLKYLWRGTSLVHNKSEGFKKVKTEFYYLRSDSIESTSIDITEYDKYGNILFQKSNLETGGKYYRYLFDDTGRIRAQYIFKEDSTMLYRIHYLYNSDKQIKTIIKNTELSVDTIDLSYDQFSNIIAIKEKGCETTYKYDKRGNCISWNRDFKHPVCGLTVGSWKGYYDEKNELWVEEDKEKPTFKNKFSPQEVIWPELTEKNYYSDEGDLVKYTLFEIKKDETIPVLSKFYEYF